MEFFISCEMKFQWSLQQLVTNQSSAHCFAQPFNHSLASEYESMAQWLRQVTVSWATWVLFQDCAETLCSPSAILRGTEPVSALT